MRSVSRFEANLLRILQCFLGHMPLEQIYALITKPEPRPRCLSRDAVELIQGTLARGVVMMLTRSGAWSKQKHLRGDEVCEGSLWQRTNPSELGLQFSPRSLDFLIWITSADVSSEAVRWIPGENSPAAKSSAQTLGDQFLIYLAVRAMKKTVIVDRWCKNNPFHSNGLIALMMPDKFTDVQETPNPDFDSWLTEGACILESLQDELADSWVQLERRKCKVINPDEMLRLGAAQENILNRFLDAVEKHGRRDLARFLLQAANQLFHPQTNRDQWIASLDTTDLRLADRTEIYRNASAFMRACQRLQTWHANSQGIGYFDEGYAESQLWKSIWESTGGAQSVAHADRIVKEFEF